MRFSATGRAWEVLRSDPHDRFVADLVRESAQAGRGYGLFGVPFDGAVIGRRGAREGPRAIREALAPLKPWTATRGEARWALRDFGDVEVAEAAEDQEGAKRAEAIDKAHQAAREAARAVLRAGLVPVALGGDHSLTHPLVAAHGKRLGIINVDAHLDVREVVDGRITSGTPFGRLLADGLLAGPNLVEAGVRDFATSPAYGAKAIRAGARLISAAEVRADPQDAAREAAAVASGATDGVYLSLDLDVLDAAHAPGVSAPTPGGLSTAELFDFLRALGREIARRSHLAGMDLVEVAPPLDADGRTARAAAHALLHFLAGLEERT